MSLGRLGYMPGSMSDEAMVLDAIKELYRLQGDEMTDSEKNFFKHEISNYTKYDCLNRLRQLNKRIKALGGNEIKRKSKRLERYNAWKLNKRN